MDQVPRQASLEERRFDAECRFREMELRIKRDESQGQLSAQKDKSPILVPVWVGVLGLVGGVLLAAVQGFFNGRLEKEKTQSNLILKAIETGNVQDSATNLRFLIQAGLLEDSSGKIIALLNKPGDVPKLPASAAFDSTNELSPHFVDVTGADSVELRCQDPANPGGTIQAMVDGNPLPAAQDRVRLPLLPPGDHVLVWSVGAPSTTPVCEAVVDGVVQFRRRLRSARSFLFLRGK